VACSSNLADLTVAEAKGCHDRDPTKRLAKAYEQANRVAILADGKPMELKRIAIVTRWASKVGGAKIPIIAVQDPHEPGAPDTAHRVGDAGVGLARLHVANLIEPLGLRTLAGCIRAMLDHRRSGPYAKTIGEGARIRDAEQALSNIRPRRIEGFTQGPEYHGEGLIGSFITLGGPLRTDEMTEGAARNLRALGLRPMFVGIDRRILEEVIKGRPDRLREETQQRQVMQDPDINADPAGTWLVDVGERVMVR
jgi:hypothetical protein